MKHIIQLLVLVSLLLTMPAWAQKNSPENPPVCGIPELTPTEARELDELAKLALRLKQASGKVNNGITYVPIRSHIFRRTNGTGGIDLAKLNTVMAATNSYYLYNGSGIQFYFAGATPDYIDNDATFATFVQANENAIAVPRDVTNAMNMYWVNAFDQAGLGGYAYFPNNSVTSTRSFILNSSNVLNLGNSLLPHELGHNFNLPHTFQGSTGSNPELVTRGIGANCTTAGDLICDTPADPYGLPGAGTTYINGCQTYIGTVTDPTGALYSPSITNIMSYYNPCTHDFSLGQYTRMDAGLALRQSHSAYTLTYPPTVVSPPTNLSATLTASGFVTLTWTDNATNEMGYFIERATNPGGPFSCVGGVAPDIQTFTDLTVAGLTIYYYRIRPSNSTTGSLSPVVNVMPPICQPVYSTSCSAGNGLAGVTLNGVPLSVGSGCSPGNFSSSTVISGIVSAGQSCTFNTTLLNTSSSLSTAIWIDLNRNNVYETTELLFRSANTSTLPQTGLITLPASLTTGPLRIRVLTGNGTPTNPCGSYTNGETEDYVLNVVQSTLCLTPTGLSSASVTGTTAQLNWTPPTSGLTYALQWRPIGGANWTTVGGLTAPTHTLTGLGAATAFEWQVLTVCPLVGSSVLSAPATFTTSCVPPNSLTTNAIFATRAQLNWTTIGTGITYSLQWRLQGAATWTTVSPVAGGVYSLTGLMANTPYEWRVSSNCGSVGNSAYTNPISFSTNNEVFLCRPTSTQNCTDTDGLSGFTLNTSVLSTNSGCSPGGYQTFTAVVPTVAPGQVCSFTAILLSTQFSEGVTIWVDANQNSTFETSERVFRTAAFVTGSLSGSLTIPVSASTGTVRMRVMVAYEVHMNDPCGYYEYGETEDYLLNVSNPTACTAMQTVQNGSWNDPATWSCNRVPTAADNVEVRHIITVPSPPIGYARKVQYSNAGKLVYAAGGRLQLGQ